MTAESKKLQTEAIRLDSGEFELSVYSGWAAVHHDALIAHEQREVIQKMAQQLESLADDMEKAGHLMCDCEGCRLYANAREYNSAALTAAAPYLED